MLWLMECGKVHDVLLDFLIAIAWPVFGLGYLGLYFHYLPSGAQFFSEAFGLLIAGSASGLVFLRTHGKRRMSSWQGWTQLTFLLFSPVGLLGALLVAELVTGRTTETSPGALLVAPFLMTLSGNFVIVVGFAVMGLINRVARGVSVRLRTGRQPETARP